MNFTIKNIVDIAKKAGEITMDLYNCKYAIEEKENRTLITDADKSSHEFLVKKLMPYGFPIISEEGLVDGNDLSHTWIIDPLDGTSDFIQQTGQFSIMIGLIDAYGSSVLGVVYAPFLDELYYAEKNGGAFACKPQRDCESEQISVSKRKMNGGTILVSRNHLGKIEQKVAKKNHMIQVPMGSSGLKMCRIAKGDAELYINSSDKSGIWDVCAADVIIREANGYIMNLKNHQIVYEGDYLLRNGYIVSNGEIIF